MSQSPEREFATEVVKRAPILAELADHDGLTLGDLEAAVPQSRSTVHRALDRFVDWRLVEHGDGEYTLSTFGETVAAEVTAFTTRLETASHLDALLDVPGTGDVDVPLAHLTDARVVTPDSSLAHQGVKRIMDLFEQADSVRVLSSVLSSLYVDGAVQAMHQGTDVEVVFDEDLLEDIRSEYADEAAEALATGHFSLYVHPAVPFELFIYDDRFGIAVHDEMGRPRMYVESDNSEAMAWAEGLYRTYRDEGRPVDLTEGS